MKIHHEGTASIVLVLVVVVLLTLTTFYFSRHFWWTAAISFLGIMLWWIVLFFFRVPKRNLTMDAQAIVSPANGKVVEIKRVFEKEYLHKECTQVSIFMSPFNVHLNKYPVSGQVVYSKYHPGKYLVAWAPKASEINERHSVVIAYDEGKQQLLVKQIAGFLARRIVNYAEVGKPVTQNEELGFIKFGSRVDLFLPTATDISVRIGDETVEGVTVIGRTP